MTSLAEFVGPSARVASFLQQHGIDRFVVGECVEVLACPTPRRGWRGSELGTSVAPEPFAVAASIPLNTLVRRYRQRHPNEFSGPKWGIRGLVGGLKDDAGGRVKVTLAATTWEQVRAIQEPLLTGGPEEPAIREACGAGPLHPEAAPIPSIGVAHAALLTSDNQLVVAQRSSRVAYFPGTRSVSFEEQLSAEDLASTNAIAAAAARGANEELTASRSLVTPEDVSVLSFFLEYYNLNLAACAVVRARLPYDELRTRWREAHPDPEFSRLDAMPFTQESLPAVARQVLSGAGSWHPSSQYRVVKAMLYVFGYDLTVAAFAAAGRPAAQIPA